MRRRVAVLFVGVLVAGVVPFVGVASAHDSGPSSVTAAITGGDVFVRNRLSGLTFQFPDVIRVAPGGTVTFVNKTQDFHSMSVVGEADRPNNAKQVNNCQVCNAVNGVYGLSGPNSKPLGLQIQDGKLGGGFRPDPAVKNPPFGLPANEIRFDDPSHANGTIGDSTVVGFAAATPGFTARTVKVSASPGTFLYMCTFHPWMQAKIIVG
jgi:plastocyanin